MSTPSVAKWEKIGLLHFTFKRDVFFTFLLGNEGTGKKLIEYVFVFQANTSQIILLASVSTEKIFSLISKQSERAFESYFSDRRLSCQ